MKLNQKNLSPLGFLSTVMVTPTSLSLHWCVRGLRLEVADGVYDRLGYFGLAKKEMQAFKAGKLSVVSPGFCNASGGHTKDTGYVLLFEGKPRSKKHVEQIFS